eukprot:3093306-Rhodomonas_salina.2
MLLPGYYIVSNFSTPATHTSRSVSPQGNRGGARLKIQKMTHQALRWPPTDPMEKNALVPPKVSLCAAAIVRLFANIHRFCFALVMRLVKDGWWLAAQDLQRPNGVNQSIWQHSPLPKGNLHHVLRPVPAKRGMLSLRPLPKRGSKVRPAPAKPDPSPPVCLGQWDPHELAAEPELTAASGTTVAPSPLTYIYRCADEFCDR